ncbi:hypothetical protein GC176_04385 [bacterium]|nr:hypothetical protein [bacterium]
MLRANLTILATLAVSVLCQSLLRSEDLFRLVQPDAMVCVHLSEAAENGRRLEQSEFAKRLQASPFWADIADNPQLADLTHAKAALEAVLQRPLREAVESLFGQNVVLAVFASPGSNPNFVLLLEADSAAAIESAVTAWQALDGFQQVELEHRGVTYRSLKKPGRSDDHNPVIVQFDRVLVVAQKTERLQRVIDLRLDASADSLATLEPFMDAVTARPEGELVAVHVNPRSLDSAVTSFVGNPQNRLRSLANAWSRCRWLTLRLVLGTDLQSPDEMTSDEVRFEVIADYGSQGTPDWWNGWVGLATTQRLPLNRIPQNALLALSGQFSSNSLQTLIRKSLPSDGELPVDARRVWRVSQGLLLGLDPLTDLLPALGPNWLAYCVPRPTAESSDFPVDALIALDLRPEESNASSTPPVEPGTVPQPSLQDALDNALLTGLNLLAAEHNSRTTGPVAVLRHKAVAEGTIRWAEPVSRFRPAYAVSNNFLLVASSPELCERFLATTSARTKSQSDSEEKSANEPTQYWLARSTIARQILKSHRDWFLWQARRDRVPDAEASRRLTELDSVLKLADDAEFSASLSDSQIRASLSLSATSPGRK